MSRNMGKRFCKKCSYVLQRTEGRGWSSWSSLPPVSTWRKYPKKTAHSYEFIRIETRMRTS